VNDGGYDSAVRRCRNPVKALCLGTVRERCRQSRRLAARISPPVRVVQPTPAERRSPDGRTPGRLAVVFVLLRPAIRRGRSG
jgi:hypothetical protein